MINFKRLRQATAKTMQANEAVLKSKQKRRAKNVERFRQSAQEHKLIQRELGGETPISERGLDRPAPPRLPPNYRGT